jgi:hypothetical protein
MTKWPRASRLLWASTIIRGLMCIPSPFRPLTAPSLNPAGAASGGAAQPRSGGLLARTRVNQVTSRQSSPPHHPILKCQVILPMKAGMARDSDGMHVCVVPAGEGVFISSVWLQGV